MIGQPPLLLHVFPGFGVGGAQVRFAALANRFGSRWRHAVVSLNGDVACAERIGRGVPLELVGSPVTHGGGLARAVPAIAALLKRLKPALLVTGNWGSMEWAIANRVTARLPHLHTEDGFGPEESGGQLRRRVVTRMVALRRTEVILPSLTLLRAARAEWQLPKARLHHIPNGLDLRRFSPDGAPAGFDVPGEGPVVGTVAALRPEKNLGRLLRATALLLGQGVAMRLLVIGDGPDRPRLEALAAELGIAGSVLFAGAMAEPAAAYRAMDVFCLSSDTEQMPFSVLEAMATGLPVASTDVGDVAAMVAPVNRPQVVPKDDASLAAALGILVRDATLRRDLGRANMRKAWQDYDEQQMFGAFAQLIDDTIRTG